mmetsp:Transcript_128872/g.412698  ORF Transcript_128872/g.412698 Transcript_128872/m.412698 type:complete len:229 (-) Transcript_128872:3416-4102(-)
MSTWVFMTGGLALAATAFLTAPDARGGFVVRRQGLLVGTEADGFGSVEADGLGPRDGPGDGPADDLDILGTAACAAAAGAVGTVGAGVGVGGTEEAVEAAGRECCEGRGILAGARTGALAQKVRPKRTAEDRRLLRHDADSAAQDAQWHLGDVQAVDADCATAARAQAEEQSHEGGLPRACRPDDADLFPRSHVQGHLPEGNWLPWRIPERNLVEGHRARAWPSAGTR